MKSLKWFFEYIVYNFRSSPINQVTYNLTLCKTLRDLLNAIDKLV